MSGSAVLTHAEVVLELGIDRKTARRLYSDMGGPLYKLPGTGARILTTRRSLDEYLAGPSAEPVPSASGGVTVSSIEVVDGAVFS